MAEYEFINPLIGGMLIGLSASGMLLANGRIMGVSGIIGGLFRTDKHEVSWRFVFILGLIAGGYWVLDLGYTILEYPIERGLGAAAIGGLLVGFGTTLGSGCTSGHGVCGISRLSFRSIVATVVFILFGVLSVILMKQIFGVQQ